MFLFKKYRNNISTTIPDFYTGIVVENNNKISVRSELSVKNFEMNYGVMKKLSYTKRK